MNKLRKVLLEVLDEMTYLNQLTHDKDIRISGNPEDVQRYKMGIEKVVDTLISVAREEK